MRRRLVVLAVAVLALPASALAAGAVVVPGWPVPATTGSVEQAQNGGAALISETFSDDGMSSVVSAYAPSGARRWIARMIWQCGNCDDGGSLGTLTPDGNYDNLGPEGDGGVSAVTQSGALTAGCIGARLADGTCIVHSSDDQVDRALIVAFDRGGHERWRWQAPADAARTALGLEAPPRTFSDGVTVYTSLFVLGPNREFTGSQRLVALDAATGALRWQLENTVPQALIGTGVIVVQSDGVALIDADGRRVWGGAAVPRKFGLRTVHTDATHRRVHLTIGHGGRNPATAVVTLDARTGAQIRRTANVAMAEVRSVNPNGTVLMSVRTNGHHALRAIRLDGRTAWQFPTATAVVGARRLSDGSVAVSTASTDVHSVAGLLWRLRIGAAPASTPRRLTISLGRRTYRNVCAAATVGSGCVAQPGLGTLLRVSAPAPLGVTLRWIGSDGSTTTQRLRMPAGPSTTRVVGGPRGVSRLEVRASATGRVLARFRVTVLAPSS